MKTNKVDKRQNRHIVKSSKKKTPPEDASNIRRGLTDHADKSSMAAESNTNVVLSSRQLPSSAVGDSSVTRRVEYVPPSDELIAKFAFEVCAELDRLHPSAGYATTVVRSGFQRFMTVVASITAKQMNEKGAQWATSDEANPPSSET